MSHSHPSQQAAVLIAELRQFTGDTLRYRHSLNRRLIYTPGVRHLAEAAGAYWLIDAVASWLGSNCYRQEVAADPRIAALHFWKLDVRDDRSATLTARVDSGVKPFIVQEINFTDFCLPTIDLWSAFSGAHWTLYLPSEH